MPKPKKAAVPAEFVPPMKALGVSGIRPGKWHCEIKFDGYRAIAVIKKKDALLWSRNRKPLEYPEITADLRRLACSDATIDGEIVALNETGHSSFQLLQGRAMGDRPPIIFYVFDLLHVDGESILDWPIEERRKRLEKLVGKKANTIKLSPLFDVEPGVLLEESRKQGLEGIILKARESRYEPDQRSGTWLKVKNINEQEFVVGGFSPPRNSRSNFGSIAVGYYEKGKLVYAGKVGAGFDRKQLASLHKEFLARQTETCPFANLPLSHKSRFGQGMTRSAMKEMTWIRPELVAQIKFAEWTLEGILRQPVFLGMREDKKPTDVKREVAAVGNR